MIRSPFDHARMAAVLAPVDQAFLASETKWGVARLERLVSTATLESYRRGWLAYRHALDEGDSGAVEVIVPKMIAALAYMDNEATAAGHQPLSVDTWETSISNGVVLTLVRTMPEAHALARESAGRQRLIYTLEEIGRIISHYEMTNAIKLSFPGAEVTGTVTPGDKVGSGIQLSSGEVADWTRSEPMAEMLYGETA